MEKKEEIKEEEKREGRVGKEKRKINIFERGDGSKNDFQYSRLFVTNRPAISRTILQ